MLHRRFENTDFTYTISETRTEVERCSCKNVPSGLYPVSLGTTLCCSSYQTVPSLCQNVNAPTTKIRLTIFTSGSLRPCTGSGSAGADRCLSSCVCRLVATHRGNAPCSCHCRLLQFFRFHALANAAHALRKMRHAKIDNHSIKVSGNMAWAAGWLSFECTQHQEGSVRTTVRAGVDNSFAHLRLRGAHTHDFIPLCLIYLL